MLNKSILYLLLFSVFPFFIVGCENQQINLVSEEVEEVELDFSNFSLEGMELNLNLTDEDGYIITDLSEYKIEDVFDELSELWFLENSEDEFQDLFTIYNVEKNTFAIKEGLKDLSEMIEEDVAIQNNNCGEDETWNYIETCENQSCLRTVIEEAHSHLSTHLKANNCVETRLRRTSKGVMVCVRSIEC